jgi:hypothetical protein
MGLVVACRPAHAQVDVSRLCDGIGQLTSLEISLFLISDFEVPLF